MGLNQCNHLDPLTLNALTVRARLAVELPQVPCLFPFYSYILPPYNGKRKRINGFISGKTILFFHFYIPPYDGKIYQHFLLTNCRFRGNI
nr:MAG TPA: hypothetical protein [Caudoviricetes sp.]